jgi:hypothetical protein
MKNVIDELLEEITPEMQKQKNESMIDDLIQYEGKKWGEKSYAFICGANWALNEFKTDILYEFVYSSCIHESAAGTMSLHRTRNGAEMAMEFHKEQARKGFEEMVKDYKGNWNLKFGEHEYWGVREIKIED